MRTQRGENYMSCKARLDHCLLKYIKQEKICYWLKVVGVVVLNKTGSSFMAILYSIYLSYTGAYDCIVFLFFVFLAGGHTE